MRTHHPNHTRLYKPPCLSADQKHIITQWLAPRATHHPCSSDHHHSHHPFPIQPTANNKATRTTTHTSCKCMNPMTNSKDKQRQKRRNPITLHINMQNTRDQKHRGPNTPTNPIHDSANLETTSNPTNQSRFRTTLTLIPTQTKQTR